MRYGIFMERVMELREALQIAQEIRQSMQRGGSYFGGIGRRFLQRAFSGAVAVGSGGGAGGGDAAVVESPVAYGMLWSGAAAICLWRGGGEMVVRTRRVRSAAARQVDVAGGGAVCAERKGGGVGDVGDLRVCGGGGVDAAGVVDGVVFAGGACVVADFAAVVFGAEGSYLVGGGGGVGAGSRRDVSYACFRRGC